MSLLERLEKQKSALRVEGQNISQQNESATSTKQNNFNQIKETLHNEVINLLKEDTNSKDLNEHEKEAFYKDAIGTLIESKEFNIARGEKNRIITEIYNDIVGLGPLEPLINDPDITEIMVNGYDRVYVENKGKIILTQVKFKDEEHVINIINRIVNSVGRRIDESSPMVDARLADGSRVNAVIPPIVLSGPSITIRKFSKSPLTVSDLIQFSSVSPPMMAFLEACVKGRLNIIVSGGTGSGKTTLLGVLSAYIPNDERIVTIEDAAELQLRQDHVITLETRPANIEGAGQITIRDLVRNSLRMRPNRIVVGEVRSGETLDMLQAMNTGHDGSLTTAHANSPRDVVSRLETMVLMSGLEMPIKAIREQIAAAMDLIVHVSRMRDGSRKITNITEIVGIEGDTITLQDLFVYRPGGVHANGKSKGRFDSTGTRPAFAEKLNASGIKLKDDWFQTEVFKW